ncbi:MAG: hypothetical protein ACHQK8_08910 [Bacteroidia bacterium]
MLKDITEYKAEGVGVAVVQEWDDKIDDVVYNVYVLNFKKKPIEAVLVMSKGFGLIDGEERRTSTLRHFLDNIEAGTFCKIEPIPYDLFIMNNEYLLTYFFEGHLYEKNYLFESNTIHPDNFKQVPILNKPGILLT